MLPSMLSFNYSFTYLFIYLSITPLKLKIDAWYFQYLNNNYRYNYILEIKIIIKNKKTKKKCYVRSTVFTHVPCNVQLFCTMSDTSTEDNADNIGSNLLSNSPFISLLNSLTCFFMFFF